MPRIRARTPMQQPSLAKAAVKAGMWTLAGQGTSQVLRLASNLLLTRLLAPESFGLMAVATVIGIGVYMFSDLGLRQVIVRSRRTADASFVNTVWTLQILQGLAIAAILLLISAALVIARQLHFMPAGSTYAAEDLPLLVAGLALGAAIGGFESTRLATAEKEMRLRPVVTLEVGSQVAGLLAMTAAALVHPTVFVLLVGNVVGGAAKVAASHLLPFGIPNRLTWSVPVAREVCRISSLIVVSSALTFLSANLDKLALAWLLGSHKMGQFAIAALLVGAASDLVARISSRVAYPAIAQAFERNNAGLAYSYQASRIPMDAFCLVLAAFLFWFGGDVVRLLYDERYAPAGEFLEILAITLLGSRYTLVTYVYLLVGRTAFMAAEQAIRLAGLLVAILVGYRLDGATGAVWGVALGQLAGSLAGLLVFQPRLGLFSLRRELAALALFAGIFGLFGYVTH